MPGPVLRAGGTEMNQTWSRGPGRMLDQREACEQWQEGFLPAESPGTVGAGKAAWRRRGQPEEMRK